MHKLSLVVILLSLCQNAIRAGVFLVILPVYVACLASVAVFSCMTEKIWFLKSGGRRKRATVGTKVQSTHALFCIEGSWFFVFGENCVLYKSKFDVRTNNHCWHLHCLPQIIEVFQSHSVFCPCSLICLRISHTLAPGHIVTIIGLILISFLFKLGIWVFDTGKLLPFFAVLFNIEWCTAILYSLLINSSVYCLLILEFSTYCLPSTKFFICLMC